MSASPESFNWHTPPWAGGVAKYRLGLKPIELNDWFSPISEELLGYKRTLLDERYNDVVLVTEDSDESEKLLAQHFGCQRVPGYSYPDVIAHLSLQVADDLCLIEAHGHQRLLAASVCSPTYWNVKEKIGRSLAEIHQPVTSLEQKIGKKIARAISNAPLLQPFERANWFVHSDSDRFHTEAEAVMPGEPDSWIVRSERETICRFHDELALFTINVRFAELREIHHHPDARADMIKSLDLFDHDEIRYFGGLDKFRRLKEYLG